MRVVVLVDESLFDPADPNFAQVPPKPWEAEFSVSHALRSLGHKTIGIPATADIADTLFKIKSAKPNLVFNMVEEIGGQREFDSLIVEILELANIPHTGASSKALALCRNKYLSKLVVADAGIAVPKGVLVSASNHFIGSVRFPVIVKPVGLDGSEGVTARSYVQTASALKRRISQLLRSSPQGVLCEEYIPGRELIVTVSGSSTVTVDSICELVFPPTSRIKFATASAKFDKRYRERLGITYKTPVTLDLPTEALVSSAAMTVYRALCINAYAKVEFRVKQDKVVFIEANPNSQLSRFANSTDFSSIGYERFINKILCLGLKRRRL